MSLVVERGVRGLVDAPLLAVVAGLEAPDAGALVEHEEEDAELVRRLADDVAPHGLADEAGRALVRFPGGLREGEGQVSGGE